MRKHIYVLGGIYTLLCGLTLALGLTLILVLWADLRNGGAVELIAPVFLLVAALVLLPGLIGGIGLLYFRPWSRALLFLPSLLFLFLVPVGTVLGAYALWVLLNAETRALLDGDGTGSLSGSPAPLVPQSLAPHSLLLFMMACVGAGFFLVIKIGFVLHGQPEPPPLDSSLLTGIAVAVLVGGFAAGTMRLIHYSASAVTGARIRREANRSAVMYREARRVRVAELAADPERAKYAPLVERGEDWSEENIAYDRDPAMTVTCDHLQPIESAMRRAGVSVRRFQKTDVVANCRIDYGALEQAFGATPVRYSEFYVAERYEFDHPTAFLICDEHKSMIHVVHPEQSEADKIPLFPVGTAQESTVTA